jgi:hypothetical protein
MSQSDSTNALQNITDVATIANYFQINSINNKIHEIENTINQSAIEEEQQKNKRHVIFQINNFITKIVENTKDKLVVVIALLAIKRNLSKSRLNSSSFAQISDMKYFQETVDLLDSKIKEFQSIESEATTVEVAYRHYKAFYRISMVSHYIKILLESVNNSKRNAIIAFMIGFVLPFLCLCFQTVYDSSSIFMVFIIMVLVGGTIIAIAVIIKYKDKNEMLEKSLRETLPYFSMADLQVNAENLVPLLNTSTQKEKILKIKIDNYEKEHPDLLLINQLL